MAMVSEAVCVLSTRSNATRCPAQSTTATAMGGKFCRSTSAIAAWTTRRASASVIADP
jgi:hypothetical protein